MPKVKITVEFTHEVAVDELLTEDEAEEKGTAEDDGTDWVAPDDDELAERLSGKIGEGGVAVEDLDGFVDGTVTVKLVKD